MLIFDRSKCAIEQLLKTNFEEIMVKKGHRNFETKLLYRASDHGYMAEDFHKLSDNKGPTVTLFKIAENQECIGGYTEAKWESPDLEMSVYDPQAFLFNLSSENVFPCNKQRKAITCKNSYGPYFGNRELYVIEPFNKKNRCSSYIDRDAYKIKENEEGKNGLTNMKFGKHGLDGIKSDFTI